MNFLLKTKVGITVDDSKVKGQLAKTKSTFVNTINKMKASVRGLSDRFKVAFGKMVRIAKWGGLAIAGAFVLVAKAAMKQEDAEKRLIITLKATGNAAGFTAAELMKQASALQEVTRFGDETVIAMQTMLLTFKNIKGDEFKRATEAALDMATAEAAVSGRAVDLTAVSIRLGKALNDPVLGMSALSKVGVAFTDVQKEMVKQMVAVGNVAGAQNIILKELEGQFGGMSRDVDTASGALKQMWNRLGDVAETIGKTLLPFIKESAISIKNWAKDNQKAIGDWAKDTWARLTEVMSKFVAFGKVLWEHKTVLIAVTAAYVGLLIVGKVTAGVTILMGAITGLTVAYTALLGVQALSVTSAYILSNAQIAAATSGLKGVAAQTAMIAAAGKYKVMLTALIPTLMKVGVAAAAAFTIYQITRLITKMVEYRGVLKSVAKHQEKMNDLVLEAARRRALAAEAKTVAESPLVKAAKEYAEVLKQQVADAPGIAAASTELADKIAEAHKDMGDELRRQTWDTTKYQLENLKERYNAYKEYVTNKELLANWYAALQKEILDEQKGDYTKYLTELRDQTVNSTRYMGDRYGELARSIQSSGSDAFQNLTKAGSDWKDALNGFILDVTNSYRKMLSDMAAQQLMSAMLGQGVSGGGGMGGGGLLGGLLGGIGKLFGGGAIATPGTTEIIPGAVIAHRGGVIGVDSFPKRKVPADIFANAPRYHGLRPGEQAIIAEKGEVISRPGEGSEGTTNITLNINAIDTQSGVQFLAKNERQIAGLVQNAARKNSPSRRGGV